MIRVKIAEELPNDFEFLVRFCWKCCYFWLLTWR